MIERKDCTCSCHRTGAIHFVPCCHEPIPDEIKLVIDSIRPPTVIGWDMAKDLSIGGWAMYEVQPDGSMKLIDMKDYRT